MPLPSSGSISIGDIRTELSNSGKAANYSLGVAGAPYGVARDAEYVPLNQSSTNKPNTNYTPSGIPRSISAWIAYDHGAQLTCSISFQTPNITGGNYVYYKTYVTGVAGTYTPIYFSLVDPDIYNYAVRIYDTYPFNNIGQITASPIYTGTGIGLLHWYQLVTTADTLHFVFWNSDVF
jgi:hypothetical protein